jgi:hypothetical protein
MAMIVLLTPQTKGLSSDIGTVSFQSGQQFGINSDIKLAFSR